MVDSTVVYSTLPSLLLLPSLQDHRLAHLTSLNTFFHFLPPAMAIPVVEIITKRVSKSEKAGLQCEL